MGKKYETVLTGGVLSTYSDDNPADDGSKTSDNRVRYSRIQSDLTAPLHSGIVNMDVKLLQMLDETPVAKTISYTTVESDYAKVIEVSGSGLTISLLNPSGNDGYKTAVKNADDSNSITIDVAGGALIDSQTNITLSPQSSAEFRVDALGTNYLKMAGETIPAGTKMFFGQAAAPLGWTQDATYDDYGLRLVSGTGAGTGGSGGVSESHNHQVQDYISSVSHANIYDAAGTPNTPSTSTSYNVLTIGAGYTSADRMIVEDMWTSKVTAFQYLDIIMATRD